jgi:hypothetical protein
VIALAAVEPAFEPKLHHRNERDASGKARAGGGAASASSTDEAVICSSSRTPSAHAHGVLVSASLVWQVIYSASLDNTIRSWDPCAPITEPEHAAVHVLGRTLGGGLCRIDAPDVVTGTTWRASRRCTRSARSSRA